MQKFQTKLKELWDPPACWVPVESMMGRIGAMGVNSMTKTSKIRLKSGTFAVLLTLRMNKKEYAVLCTDLSANDISTVVQFLGENGVTDYKIQNDTILVPAGRETQLQVQLPAHCASLCRGWPLPPRFSAAGCHRG